MTIDDATKLATLADEVTQQILEDIIELVEHESGSYDRPDLDACLADLTTRIADRLGSPDDEEHRDGGEYGDVAALTFRGTAPGHVALVGHYDTVWPTGTLGEWGQRSYRDNEGRLRLSGPGIFDMKAGLVQGIWALRLLRDHGLATPTVTFVLNGDEEIGSLSSRQVIEEIGSRADATLVLEPSANGAVKTGRKGTGIFEVTATGIESHAGLDPAAGASAVHALAEFITAATALADPAHGTTVNAGLVQGGTGTNVVAGKATARFDIRVQSTGEQQRVDKAFDAIAASDERVRIKVDHDWNRPPMTLSEASAPLLDIARKVANDIGFELRNADVGGASDANFIASLGRPVMCGLGAVGDGAHARGEFVYADTVARQTALVAGLLHRLTDPTTFAQ